MLKVGQRVKIKPEHIRNVPYGINPSATWSIDAIEGTHAAISGNGYTGWVLPLFSLRALMKKKPPLDREKKVINSTPPSILLSEIKWMEKVQKNFKSDGAVIDNGTGGIRITTDLINRLYAEMPVVTTNDTVNATLYVDEPQLEEVDEDDRDEIPF